MNNSVNMSLISKELNLSTYTEITGGTDSSVFKVYMKDGTSFALRVLPSAREHQFHQEKGIIEHAGSYGISVPKIKTIRTVGNSAIMLMEWVPGMTMLQALLEYPENARKLGMEFGRVQTTIYKIDPIDLPPQTWLTPKGGDEELIYKRLQGERYSFLHMDYHPLNVMTDGEKVTGVLDWINVSYGDPRFDYARTLSILEVAGPKAFESNPQALVDFIDGWREGYGTIELNPLFKIWAAMRMKRDFSDNGSLTIDILNRINQWLE